MKTATSLLHINKQNDIIRTCSNQGHEQVYLIDCMNFLYSRIWLFRSRKGNNILWAQNQNCYYALQKNYLTLLLMRVFKIMKKPCSRCVSTEKFVSGFLNQFLISQLNSEMVPKISTPLINQHIPLPCMHGEGYAGMDEKYLVPRMHRDIFRKLLL